jgi:hypothetical protein
MAFPRHAVCASRSLAGHPCVHDEAIPSWPLRDDDSRPRPKRRRAGQAFAGLRLELYLRPARTRPELGALWAE